MTPISLTLNATTEQPAIADFVNKDALIKTLNNGGLPGVKV